MNNGVEECMGDYRKRWKTCCRFICNTSTSPCVPGQLDQRCAKTSTVVLKKAETDMTVWAAFKNVLSTTYIVLIICSGFPHFLIYAFVWPLRRST